ncbi:flavodoxin family protein [Vibrio fluminensis]|uniref:flavodoxin family protein n=1 Tax=Vibrio fluminensis TaxID=2783614 RepID=UPI001E6233B8|nr:flavodoxin family protein [Vibrio fluminensis]
MSVAVVYHSGYGHTEKQAHAVAEGANAVLIKIDENGELTEEQWQQLDNASAIVFGSPTYMGMVSWQFKKFADASSKRWFSMDWKDKFAAGFTNSASMNGDKGVTISYLMTLAMQHGMVWIGTGLMPANTKAAQRDDVNYLGAFSGLLAQSPADASPEEAPCKGDLETARLFGQRVASFAK